MNRRGLIADFVVALTVAGLVVGFAILLTEVFK